VVSGMKVRSRLDEERYREKKEAYTVDSGHFIRKELTLPLIKSTP
jgi:hypothetical protein